jgi:class 3 adenylate cyclase/tetratricopeptide (TPR) repeat protein
MSGQFQEPADEECAMGKRVELEQAIALLEGQRAILGDAAVNAGLAELRRQLAALDPFEQQAAPARVDESLSGERKWVTILFADIAGFTAMSEQMDPEAVRDLGTACFKEFVPVIEDYGGTVARFMGDSILALFGAPVAHENDAERACRAALDIMQALAAFHTGRGTDVGLHLGINTGLVVAGALGTSERQEYSVTGDAANLAARLQAAAGRGEILVGPDTYHATSTVFDFEARKPIEVKGRSKPVHVYRVVGLKPRRVRWTESAGTSSPLVGRGAELAAVAERVRATAAGQGGVLAVIGEAGLGKSRLMAEARKASVGVRWREGRALSFGQSVSYRPFQEILWRFAGITEEDTENAAWERLERAVTALCGAETEEVLPYLASLLSLPVQARYAERVKYLDGESMGRQIFRTARRFFERLAQREPVVLVFEDLHWMDQSSAELLEHLLPVVERAPLLICGVSRPEPGPCGARLSEIGAREYSVRYTEVCLKPLSESDSAQLLRNLLGLADIPEPVRAMMAQRAEGNPFFLEEIIRALIDARIMIRDENGRWRATAAVETIAIPDTIHGVIMSRIDRLDDDVKEVLRAAAVIGRSFLYRILRAIDAADRRLDEHLAELQAIELIRKKQAGPELEYIFKHALAQEATYASILLDRRRDLHARVGAVIEELFENRLEEFYALLAYHYAQAEEWPKAHEYLRKAGDQAGRLAADTEAIAHYRQAMVTYEWAFGDRWDPLERAQLERKMGQALLRRGQHLEAREYLNRALALLGWQFPTSRPAFVFAIAKEIAVQLAHRLAPSVLTRRPTTAAMPNLEEVLHAEESLSWIDVPMHNWDRVIWIELRCLNEAERRGYVRGIVTAGATIGLVLDAVVGWRLGRGYYARAAAIVGEMRDPAAAAFAHCHMEVSACYGAEWDSVQEYGRLALEPAWMSGDVRQWGWALMILAVRSANLGDFDDALARCAELERVGEDTGDAEVHSLGLAMKGFVKQRLGRIDEALRSVLQAMPLADAVHDLAFVTGTRADAGRCYLRQGRIEEALHILHEGLRYWVPAGDAYGCLRNAVAEAYLQAAEGAKGEEQVRRLKQAAEACRAALTQSKKWRPGLPEAMRLQGTYEWLRGRPDAARKWWQRSLELAEKMGQRYDVGMTHLERGRRMDDRPHLERALAICGEIGAEWGLAQARGALEKMRGR